MQNRLPKPLILLLFVSLFCNYLTVTAQCTTTLWLEDFSGNSNGATSDAGTTAWTSSSTGSGTYSVQNHEFKTAFSCEAVGTWTSQVIDISSNSNVTFSIDLRSEVES